MNPDQSTAQPAASLPKKIVLAALIVATLAACYFSNLGAIGFVGPDEPRYAWIARDMAETGDWITPRLYGRPWFEKPPLYYWMAGVSFKVFGVSEVTARLPSAICALFATLALAWLAWRVYGEETARWLLLLLPTSIGMIGFSHAAATDMPFSAALTIALVCAAVILGFTRDEKTPILPRTPWLALLLFGFFLGLSVLAKGPAGIILCGGGVFFWALLAKRWRDAFRLLHPITILSFCVTALPWYILCARRNPDFFRVFIIEHNFKRYLTPEFQHIQPFWYYVPVLLAELLPWAAIAVGALLGRCFDKSSFQFSPVTGLLLSWALFCVAFFSASKSKLPGYILPALPAVVFLIAIAISSTKRALSAGAAIGALTAAVVFSAIGLLPIVIASPRNSFIAIGGTIFGAFGIANLFSVLALRRRFSANARALLQLLAITPFLLLFAGVKTAVNHHWFLVKSPRSVALLLIRENIPAERLSTLSLKRDTQYALSFYLHSEIASWENNKPVDGFVLTDGRSCKQLSGPWDCEVVWDRRDLGDSVWSLLRVKPANSASGPAHSGQMR